MATFQIYDLSGAIWLMQDKLLLNRKWYNVIINVEIVYGQLVRLAKNEANASESEMSDSFERKQFQNNLNIR